MNRIEIAIVAIVVIVVCSVTITKIDKVEDMMISGEHLKNVKVLASISSDVPWEKLPLFLRDDMAKGWSGNRLSKQELIAIRDYYNQKIEVMKDEPIAIGEDFKEGKLVKKEE